MRKVEAVIPPHSLGNVSEALLQAKIGSYRASDVTVLEPGTPKGTYRGVEYTVGRELVKLEIVVPDQEVQFAVDAIRLGLDDSGGDAEVLVIPVFDEIRLNVRAGARKAVR